MSERSHHRRRAGQSCSSDARRLCRPRSFTSLCYSADGQSVLAGGLSKFVCIYNVREQLLVKKFEISSNLSFDAMEVSRLQPEQASSSEFSPLQELGPGATSGCVLAFSS